MNTTAEQHRSWGRRQWCTLLGLVVTVQLGLIFWLGERGEPRPRNVTGAPALRMAATVASGWLALQDSTLFALPHQQGFSGPAWFHGSKPPGQPYLWAEPDHWDEPNPAQLAAPFELLIRSNSPSPMPELAHPEPELTASAVDMSQKLRQETGFRITGALAKRRLLAPVTLPSWTNADTLTNTVIQMVVGGNGLPISLLVIPPGCGDKGADEFALEIARQTRFEPLSSGASQRSVPPLEGLTFGNLIFEWHTVLTAPTNPPP